MGKPTKKMLRFADFIEAWSGVSMPNEARTDFDVCSAYIAAHKDQANKNKFDAKIRNMNKEIAESSRRASLRRRNQGGGSVPETVGGDYGVANNDMGIDCYDCGISPWGDS